MSLYFMKNIAAQRGAERMSSRPSPLQEKNKLVPRPRIQKKIWSDQQYSKKICLGLSLQKKIKQTRICRKKIKPSLNLEKQAETQSCGSHFVF